MGGLIIMVKQKSRCFGKKQWLRDIVLIIATSTIVIIGRASYTVISKEYCWR